MKQQWKYNNSALDQMTNNQGVFCIYEAYNLSKETQVDRNFVVMRESQVSSTVQLFFRKYHNVE